MKSEKPVVLHSNSYNKELKKMRKTELPPVYEPLIVNCDLLFALADKLNIDTERKLWIEEILKTKENGVFLSDSMNERYSFNNQNKDSSIVYIADSIEIPANLITQGATIEVIVNGSTVTTYSDWELTKVSRDGDDVESFIAYYSSKSIEKAEWTTGTEVTVNIYNGMDYDPVTFRFKVSEMKSQVLFLRCYEEMISIICFDFLFIANIV